MGLAASVMLAACVPDPGGSADYGGYGPGYVQPGYVQPGYIEPGPTYIQPYGYVPPPSYGFGVVRERDFRDRDRYRGRDYNDQRYRGDQERFNRDRGDRGRGDSGRGDRDRGDRGRGAEQRQENRQGPVSRGAPGGLFPGLPRPAPVPQ